MHIASLYFNLDPTRASGSPRVAVGHGGAARRHGHRFTLIANEARRGRVPPRSFDELITLPATEFTTAADGFADAGLLEILLQRYVNALQNLHARRPIDVVLAHHASFALEIARRFNATLARAVRIVAFVHGTELYDARHEPKLRALIRLTRGADAVVVADESQRAHLLEMVGGPLDNVLSIPPLADFEMFLDDEVPAESLAGDPPLIAVARLVPEKGIGELVQLIGRVRARLPQAALHVLGAGPDGALLAGVDGVVAYGAIDHDRVAGFLRGAKAFVFLPRWEEPYGLAPLEAFVAGTPVVLRAAGRLEANFQEASTLTAPERAGAAFSPDTSIDTVADWIAGAVPGLARLSRGARRRLADHFGPAGRWQQLAAVLEPTRVAC